MTCYGRTAVVNYRGTLSDGTVFDSTEGIEPLEFVVGSGTIIHGFDEAVAGMSVGERRTVTIPSREAYGDYSEERVEKSPMYAIPNAKDIKVGKLFYFITDEGLRFPAKVTEINEGVATVDFNHPLAGEDLTFEIELVAEKD
ncbi:FKBP-type peptidyl-prolyl cis-trans isomerase [Raoultibacter massiliensis]|uniref:Peptidyl-prolyl cis-trans isomerase n=1 Tax=Raoultibacter massiliensis TaxID=1852371 RepID=A0ABV1JER8_9ACTN